ncbi:MAG: hypothetical protein J0M33_13480 [Anaerolineae bacterium]|nr:hypothetical protein [Anaerolineae bacterium]
MYFQLKTLSPELIYIRWYATKQPACQPQTAFIAHLRQRLDETTTPLCFLSDLRYGRIQDVGVIQQLASLTQHPNWAGSAAFSENLISQIMVGSFTRLRRSPEPPSRRELFTKPNEAIASLEHLKAGLTTDIDWTATLA